MSNPVPALAPAPPGVDYIESSKVPLPVGVDDKRPMSLKARITFIIIALFAAAGWGMIAFARGETINAVWIVFAAVGSYFIAYSFWGRLIEYKVVKPRDNRATPAEYINDGQDFVPTDRRVLFGHHFAAIAGAGPSSAQLWQLKWAIFLAPCGSCSA